MVNLLTIKHLQIGMFFDRRNNVKVANMVKYKVKHVHYNERF